MSSDTIKKLTDYQHARTRTEMYLGSRAKHTQEIIVYENGKPVLKELTWVPALYTYFREILDNAVDEVVGHGEGNRVDVTFDPKTLDISVQDNGRGIPIDYAEEHKSYLATMVLTHARAGRNFDDRGEVAGTNGIGASICNFCSEEFVLEVVRDNKKFVQKFNENPLPDGPNLKSSRAKITEIKTDKTGTKIKLRPSKAVFKDLILPEEFIRSRVYEVAVSNPLIRVYYNGERLKVNPFTEKSLFPDTKPPIIDIKVDNLRTKFIIVPNFSESGETIHSIVNNIPAFNGGVHIDTFRSTFYYNLLKALEKEGKRRRITPNRSDVTEGLLIYNVTQMKAPDFDSQSKTRLINEWVGKDIKDAIPDEEECRKLLKKHKDWTEQIFERAEARTNRKDAAEARKAAKSAKRTKVQGLMDASGKNRKDCILFLAEGLSAISGMSSVRDPNIHGGLGLRGKVLNVNGEAPKKVLENTTLVGVMNALGLMIGEKADRKYLRYGKLYIAHDMDPDGLNIGALIINFFHTYWPELLEDKDDPFLWIFNTPFIIAEKGSQRKYWYSHNIDNFDPDKYKGWTITRAKGLGTLTKEDWRFSLAQPDVYPIVDDGEVGNSLDLIFNGSRADDRKDWIGL